MRRSALVGLTCTKDGAFASADGSASGWNEKPTFKTRQALAQTARDARWSPRANDRWLRGAVT
jgi:hypothetical protein